jgi:hypothetical protein
MDLNDLKVLRARLMELGPDAVRTMLAADRFPTGMHEEISKWLADQASADHELAREPHGPARHRSAR